MKRIICLLMVFVMITGCLTGCGKKEQKECEIVLDEFEYACNELDIDAILRCLNPRISDPIRIGLAFVTNWTSMDTEDMIDEIAGALMESSEELPVNAMEIFESMELETIDFVSEDGYGALLCKLTFESMGVEIEKYIVFDMVRIEEQWYIDGFEFVDYVE